MENIEKLMNIIREDYNNNKPNFDDNVNLLFDSCYNKIFEFRETLDKLVSTGEFYNLKEDVCFLRRFLFVWCCEFRDIQIFDFLFSKYRDFLREYNAFMLYYDTKTASMFDAKIKNLSIEILNLKKLLLDINNNNVSEHTNIHKQNEPYYKQIEELERKRDLLMMQSYPA